MTPRQALNTIAAQCSKKEYCSADILAKLHCWKLDEKEIAEIMAFLVKNRFVDDVRFAVSYARDKFRFNRWGKLKIEQMLRQKQIPSSVIAEALASLPEDSCDETCLALLRQKNNTLKETDPYKRKAKLFRFALGRGFDYELVCRCMEKL